MENCKYCLGTTAFKPRLCYSCNLAMVNTHVANADHVLAHCLEVLEIKGPTAEMFLRRSKEVADKARAKT